MTLLTLFKNEIETTDEAKAAEKTQASGDVVQADAFQGDAFSSEVATGEGVPQDGGPEKGTLVRLQGASASAKTGIPLPGALV